MGRSDVRSKRHDAESPPAPAEVKPAEVLGDVAFAYGKDEHGVHILRRRSVDAPIEAGVIRPLVEGRPITEEVVSLTPRSEAPGLFDIKVELESSRPRPAGDGPSQVATDSYRKGWDTIWGRKSAGHRSLN